MTSPCSRCGNADSGYQACEVCMDCLPDTPLCMKCFVAHCREVRAEFEEDLIANGPPPGIAYQQPNYRSEKLTHARDMIAAYGHLYPEE
jgi:hypothetical protein